MKTGIKILVISVIILCLGGIYAYRVHQINQEELQKQELKRLDKLKWKLVKKNKNIDYYYDLTPRLFVLADVFPLNKKIKTNLEVRTGWIDIHDLNKIGCNPSLGRRELQANGLYDNGYQCDFYIMINDNLNTLRQIDGDRSEHSLSLDSFHYSGSYYFFKKALFDSNKLTLLIKRNDLKGKPMFFVDYETKGFMDLDSYIEHEKEFMEENNFTPEDMSCSYGPGKCR
ncbi:hypothetical protein [Acinetobacter sp. Ac_5812]|uniref:hypothetical protein n=1 Tax=Acinetobacter sp. Ac_5812 TaxID=1848937 RepID=UPI0014907593|nr:hypothetical protein [Acinetobacter sp. Ac_5812]NNP69890.1 hypothetical protein [Acinetobacter sp. Ac_5812]